MDTLGLSYYPRDGGTRNDIRVYRVLGLQLGSLNCNSTTLIATWKTPKPETVLCGGDAVVSLLIPPGDVVPWIDLRYGNSLAELLSEEAVQPLACNATNHEDTSTGTRVRIRRASKPFPLTGCYRTSADIHLGKDVAEQIVNGTQAATRAISAALAGCGLGVAAIWTALAGELVGIGYNSLKNEDGSIDLKTDNAQVRAGRTLQFPIGGAVEGKRLLDSL